MSNYYYHQVCMWVTPYKISVICQAAKKGENGGGVIPPAAQAAQIQFHPSPRPLRLVFTNQPTVCKIGPFLDLIKIVSCLLPYLAMCHDCTKSVQELLHDAVSYFCIIFSTKHGCLFCINTSCLTPKYKRVTKRRQNLGLW